MIADSFGCALASLTVLTTPPGKIVARDFRDRAVLALALGASSLVLGQGLRKPRLAPADLALGAVVNSLWVAACWRASPRQTTALGRRLVLATGFLDGGVGALQLFLALRGTDPAGQAEAYARMG